MQANGLTVDIDRSSITDGDYGYGGYIDNASLTVRDKADIQIKGNNADIRTNALRLTNGAVAVLEKGGKLTASGSKNENWGLAVEKGASFTSKGNLTITASGGYDWENREPSAYGIYMNSSTGEFSDKTSISASGNSYMNIGILSRESELKMAETVVNARDGYTAEAFSIFGGSAEITGDLTATAEEADKAYGVRLATGQTGCAKFTANNVDVTVEGKEAAGGVQINGDDTTANLSGILTAKVSGGTDYSYGLQVRDTATFSALYGDVSVESENGIGLELKNDGGETTFTNGAKINAATGVSLDSSTATFGGFSEITSDKSKSGTNIAIDASQSVLNMENAQLTATGGRTAHGLHINGGKANLTGDAVYVTVQGATDGNSGITVTNDDVQGSGGMLTAKSLSIEASGNVAKGFLVEKNSGAEISGHLYIKASDALKPDTQVFGLEVGAGARFDGDTAQIIADGMYGVGVYTHNDGSNVIFDGNAYVKAAEGVKVENAQSTFNGATLIESTEGAGKAVSAVGEVTASSATFKSDVMTNAAITAEAADEKSEIIFEKGLLTLANDTSMTASDGAAISVNSTGAGVVAYTGTTSAESDGTIDMKMNGANSYWRMTGDSRASTLANSGALLDMTADGNKFSTLTLDNLNGANGLVAMDIDASKNTDNSDVILVGDTFSGTQRVSFNRVDSQADADAAGTVIAKVNHNSGTFIAPADEESSIFYKRYLLDTKASETAGYTTDWYIKELASIDPSVKPTTTVNSVMSAASLNYHTWRSQNDKLMQRMGDLRKGGGANNGAWFRFGGSKISLGGGHGFDNEYMYYEVGYDRIIRETSQYTWFGGVAFSYGEGDSSYSRGDGDNESKAVSLYLTQINKGGSYLDLVFKLGRWDNDFAVYNTYGERITGETESTGISFSAEYGKKIALNKNGFYIEPQAQLTYGHLDGDTYTTSNGVSVHQEGIESLVGRVGFNLGWDISKTSNIYLKASVLHEFLGDYGVGMSDATGRVRLTGDYGDTWFEYGLGAAFKLGKPNSANFLYFDVERSEGGDLDMEWRWNAGFRFEM